jgi:hypothetical protein
VTRDGVTGFKRAKWRRGVRIYLRVEINGMIFRFGQEIIVVIALHE